MNKLPTLLLAAVFAAAAFTSQTLAQTCVTPPSCENLGYNKTAAMCAGLIFYAVPSTTPKFFAQKIYGTDCHRRHFVFGHDDVIQPGNREDADWNCL
ncbi:MAG: hypothetical protein ACLU99_03160 [Alphaproteobacteria bacterium]